MTLSLDFGQEKQLIQGYKDKKRHRWLTRKPKRRHSVELKILDGQDKRPYKYVLQGERDLLA